ncbi:MAG: hypothetical protein ACRD0V_15620 [Acidimicrobiales bacterium]
MTSRLGWLTLALVMAAGCRDGVDARRDEALAPPGSPMGFDLGNPSVPDRMAAWASLDGCDDRRR